MSKRYTFEEVYNAVLESLREIQCSRGNPNHSGKDDETGGEFTSGKDKGSWSIKSKKSSKDCERGQFSRTGSRKNSDNEKCGRGSKIKCKDGSKKVDEEEAILEYPKDSPKDVRRKEQEKKSKERYDNMIGKDFLRMANGIMQEAVEVSSTRDVNELRYLLSKAEQRIKSLAKEIQRLKKAASLDSCLNKIAAVKRAQEGDYGIFKKPTKK